MPSHTKKEKAKRKTAMDRINDLKFGKGREMPKKEKKTIREV